MRKVTINGKRVELSRNEAEFVKRIQQHREPEKRRAVYDGWLASASTAESRERRLKVGEALNYKLDGLSLL